MTDFGIFYDFWGSSGQFLAWSLLEDFQTAGPYICLICLVSLKCFFSSPEHEVLKVSYCGQSKSVVPHASCVVNNCFKSLFLLRPMTN